MSPRRLGLGREQIARLYRQGVPVGEIAALAGVKEATMFGHLYRMRRDGWDLEHRRDRLQRLREEKTWLLRMDFHLSD